MFLWRTTRVAQTLGGERANNVLGGLGVKKGRTLSASESGALPGG